MELQNDICRFSAPIGDNNKAGTMGYTPIIHISSLTNYNMYHADISYTDALILTYCSECVAYLDPSTLAVYSQGFMMRKEEHHIYYAHL